MHPLRPQTNLNKKKEVVVGGVEVMPVENGEEEDEGEKSQVPDRVEESPNEGNDEETTQECVAPRILPDPGQPTQRQIDDHRIDHLPFRSWCPQCVAGRATGEQHQHRKEERNIPTFLMDYLFLTRSRVVDREALLEGEEVEMKVLPIKDLSAKTVFAHVVPCKG